MPSLTSVAFTIALGAAHIVAGAPGRGPNYHSWPLKNFTSLVAFGDSYTDDSRLGYFISNNGSAPPVGWVDPVNYKAADGGRTWVEYVKQYTGANLYNYAVSGAVCSNDITPRYFASIYQDFPAIKQYEMPAYLADSKYEVNGQQFLNIPSQETVYAFWIGTNDLGVDAFLTDSNVPGTTIETYLDCVYNQVQTVYDNGGRFFVLMNVAPLELTALYGPPGNGGVGDNQYWANKSQLNETEIHYRMLEQVATVNAIYEFRTPFAVELNKRYPGATFASYDVNAVFTDIYYNPSEYLNGTAPLNVTGFINHCNVTGGDCVASTNPDAFLWFDELHPSEQTERVIAKNFVDVIRGSSKYATYWSS